MASDSMDWTPGEACREAADMADKHDADAAFCILLIRGPNGNRYDTMFRNSGLNTSEIISLLEVIKSDMLLTIRESKRKIEDAD